MNDDEKKELERRDLELWCALRGHKPVQVIERERPDFLVELPEIGWVAIEHTLALHPPDSKHRAHDRSAAARAIRDAIVAKADKTEFYRRATQAAQLWLLVVIARPDEGLQSLRERDRFYLRGFDRVEVLDRYSMQAQRLNPAG